MEYNNKTKEELINELLELKKENLELKKFLKKEGFTNFLSGKGFPETEKDLEETKDFFELIFNTSPDAAVISRISDGVIIDINKGLTAITGFTSEETVGKSIYDIGLWKDISERQKMVNELNEHGFCNNFETVFRCKDGSERVGLVSAKVFMINGTGHIISLTRDITHRKNAEDALSRTSAELKAIYDLSPVMMSVVDPNRRILFSNPAFTSLTGISEEQLKGGHACGVFGCINASDDVRGCGFGIQCSICNLSLAMEDTLTNGTIHANVEYQTTLVKKGEAKKVTLLGSTALIESNDQRNLLLCLYDITGLKQAELSLRESEQKYRALVDNAFEGIVIINLEGNILFANNSILKTFEYENLADITGKNIFGFIAPEYVAQTIDDFAKVVQGNGVEVAQSGGITSKGNRVWMESVGKIIDYEGTKADLISIRDITAKKQFEEDLRESEQKYRLLTENAADVIWVFNITYGKFTYVSPSVFHLRGITPEEAMNESLEDSLTPESIVVVKDALANDIQNFISHPEIPQRGINEIQQYHKDGRLIWVEVSTQYRYAPTGEIEVVGTSRNIEERKKIEEALRKNERMLRENNLRYERVVRGTSDGIWEWNIPTSEDYHSPRYHELLGYDFDEIPETLNGFESLVHPDDLPLVKAAQQAHFDQGTPYNIELRMRTKQDDYKWFVTRGLAEMDEHGKPIWMSGSITDITERKKVDESLKVSEDKFRNLVTNMQVGVLLQGPHAEITLSNPKALELLGITEDQLLGKTSFDPNWNVIHEDGSPFPGETHPVPQAIATRLPYRNVIMGVYRPLVNDRIWLMVDAVPQLNKDETINHVICSFIDISKRRKAEELLQKSQANLNAAQHIAHVGSWEWDIASNTISYSDEFYRIFGINPENIDNNANSLLQFIHPKDKALYIRNLRNGVLKGDNRPFGYRIIRHDGEVRHLFASGHFILNEQKKPVKGIGIIQDITQQKKTEDELRESNSYLENLINYANAPIIVWDPLFCITRFNHAFERLTGLAEKDVLGKTLEILFPVKLKEKSMNLIRKTLSGERWETVEIQIQHTDLSVKTVLWNSATLFDADGKTPVATIAQGQDITERKQVEEALRQSEFKFREMADLLPQIVFETDINGNLTFVNNQAFKILGYPEDYPIVGLSTLNFYTPESRIKAIENIRKKVSGQLETESNEYTMVRKDGSTFPALVYSNVELNEQRAVGLRGIVVDITEQKKSEALLLKAKLEAESASQAKSMFLANMSHEIRTPLNSIIGFSQLMNRDKSLTLIQKEYLNSIVRAGEHLVTLINDILELSKVEAGYAVLNPVNIDLPDFLRGIQLIFKERVRSKHLQFKFETSDSLPRHIDVDESKLRQILINLIGNAVKFTDKGVIAIRAHAEKNGMDNKLLIIEIQDTGPGIPDHELGNLFKHFVQTSSGIKKGSGTGLGLALSRELAQLMGGTITVESEFGKGSLFTFRLEIKEVGNSVTEPGGSKRVLRLKDDQKQYRILVADDKKENLQVVVNLLKLVGFETNTAADGKEALDQFIEWGPDLILMDLRMPVMDGYEASRRIKSMDNGKMTPIVALTASSVDSDRKKIESVGIQAFIRKPFNQNELLETIGNILGVQYIFEDEIQSEYEGYLYDDSAIAADIAKIPENLVLKMQEALAVADFQRLKNLIISFEKENSQLALHLMSLAKSFDYAHLQKILIIK